MRNTPASTALRPCPTTTQLPTPLPLRPTLTTPPYPLHSTPIPTTQAPTPVGPYHYAPVPITPPLPLQLCPYLNHSTPTPTLPPPHPLRLTAAERLVIGRLGVRERVGRTGRTLLEAVRGRRHGEGVARTLQTGHQTRRRVGAETAHRHAILRRTETGRGRAGRGLVSDAGAVTRVGGAVQVWEVLVFDWCWRLVTLGILFGGRSDDGAKTMMF